MFAVGIKWNRCITIHFRVRSMFRELFALFCLYQLISTNCMNVPAVPDLLYTGNVSRNMPITYTINLTNSSKEYVFRVHTKNQNPTKHHPILVVVKQQTQVLSFSVPVNVNSLVAYDNVSRILCPITPGSVDIPSSITVELSTDSPTAIPYKLFVELVKHFDILLDSESNVTVLPAQPVVFRHRFSNELDSVAVKVTSSDNTCMLMSLRDLKCPFIDHSQPQESSGLHQTVTNLGTVSTDALLHHEGFYIVLDLEPTDYACTGIERIIPSYRRHYHKVNVRSKHITVSVVSIPNHRYYLFPVFGAIAFFLLFYLWAGAFICFYNYRSRPVLGDLQVASAVGSGHVTPATLASLVSVQPAICQQQAATQPNWDVDPLSVSVLSDCPESNSATLVPGSAETSVTLTAKTPPRRAKHSWFSSTDDEDEQVDGEIQIRSSATCSPGGSGQGGIARSLSTGQPCPVPPCRHHVSETGLQPLTGANAEPQAGGSTGTTSGYRRLAADRTGVVIFNVGDLSRKQDSTLSRKYLLYFWHLIIITIFYGLPAVQLIMIYQRAVYETGDEDLCYYNFECARPLGIFSAFNNIISNVGYLMLGILFLILTAHRDVMYRGLKTADPQLTRSFGLPEHYGLYYAMGLALTMEGVMSACYHMCPSFSNFQFDTAYMYILAFLIMLKIYQIRHPDVNASAHSAYMVMALAIFLGVVGVFYGDDIFWIVFTVVFLLMSIVLNIEVYYMGQWNIDICLPRRLYRLIRTDGILCFRPVYVQRMLLLLVANVINFSLATWGVINRPRDFTFFLLGILMVNTLLYTVFYIIMKLRHREGILCVPIIFMFLACISWAVAIFFFVRRVTSWDLTPSQSRALNQPCVLFNFYDAHDIWHFMSATSLFLSFMMLMTLDDGLSGRLRHQIPVF